MSRYFSALSRKATKAAAAYRGPEGGLADSVPTREPALNTGLEQEVVRQVGSPGAPVAAASKSPQPVVKADPPQQTTAPAARAPASSLPAPLPQYGAEDAPGEQPPAPTAREPIPAAKAPDARPVVPSAPVSIAKPAKLAVTNPSMPPREEPQPTQTPKPPSSPARSAVDATYRQQTLAVPPEKPAPAPAQRETVIAREIRVVSGDPLGLRERAAPPVAPKSERPAAPEPRTRPAAVKQPPARPAPARETRNASVRIAQVNVEVHAPQSRQQSPAPPSPAAAEPRARDLAAALHRHYLRAL